MELVDTQDLKSCDHCGRAGSSPAPGTKRDKPYSLSLFFMPHSQQSHLNKSLNFVFLYRSYLKMNFNTIKMFSKAKSLFLFLSLMLILQACKKDDDTVTVSEEIKYTSHSPAIEFSSVDSIHFTPFGTSCPEIFPSDSTTQRQFDIDNDGTYDFVINIQHWFNASADSSSCNNYNFSIYISGIDKNREVATDGIYNIANFYDSNEEIGALGESVSWNKNSTLMLKVSGAPYSTDFIGDKYIGLKIIGEEDYNYGWLQITKSNLTLKVSGYALNEKVKQSIRAGQKE